MFDFTCKWFEMKESFSRNLSLKEARLVPKETSLSLLNRTTAPDKKVRDVAFKNFDGIDLKERDLRFANLFEAVLAKADLRKARLQGAYLVASQCNGQVNLDTALGTF